MRVPLSLFGHLREALSRCPRLGGEKLGGAYRHCSRLAVVGLLLHPAGGIDRCFELRADAKTKVWKMVLFRSCLWASMFCERTKKARGGIWHRNVKLLSCHGLRCQGPKQNPCESSQPFVNWLDMSRPGTCIKESFAKCMYLYTCIYIYACVRYTHVMYTCIHVYYCYHD